MDKILLTGATGHIGNVVARLLVEKGFKVTALIVKDENIEPISDLNLNIVYGDVRDKSLLLSLIDENTVVFHLAGIINIGIKNIDLIYDVNVGGTKNIVDCCVEKNAKKLIYTSSVHTIYPEKGVVLYEPEVFDETKIEGEYAKTKTIATKYVFDACKNRGLKAVVTYPAGVIGPYDYKISELGQVVLDYINKKLLAYVKGGYNFVDVRDVADGIIKAYEHGKIGEGYILSGEYVPLKKLFNIINKKIGRKGLPPLLAIGFVRMFARACENYYIRRNKKPLFTWYSLYTLTSNSNFCNEKAKKELGYTTRSFESTIFDTIDWFVNNKPELINFKKIKNKSLKPKTTN